MKIMKSVTAGLMCGLMLLFAGCGSDEPNQDPESQTYHGQMVSSIPAMNFTAAPVDQEVEVKWQDAGKTTATVEVDGFNVTLQQMGGKTIEIGDMDITGVKCEKNGDGTVTLTQPDFRCIAGKYETTGSLTGTISTGGELTLTLNYKPGSMPFEVNSVFTGN